MVIFENPNSPTQPQRGVYAWYARKPGDEPLTIYVGMAGKKDSIILKGTLFRGISELQRNTFTSNSPDYNALDTDFIVGTAIKCFRDHGFSCVWRHIDNDPRNEVECVRVQKPILQNANGLIWPKYRLRKSEKGYWQVRKTKGGVAEAEKELYRVLEMPRQQAD
jgi:hypothetical protein